MQRLVVAALLLAVVSGLVAIFALGLRAKRSEPDGLPVESEGGSLQKLAFAALFLLIAGVSTGILTGL